METRAAPGRRQGQALEGGQALDQGLAPAGQLGRLGGLLLLQIGELSLKLVQGRLGLPGPPPHAATSWYCRSATSWAKAVAFAESLVPWARLARSAASMLSSSCLSCAAASSGNRSSKSSRPAPIARSKGDPRDRHRTEM